MSDEDKGIEVEIETEKPDPGKEVEIKAAEVAKTDADKDKPKEKEKPAVVAKPAGDFEDLKKQFDDLQKKEEIERQGRAAAEQRASQRERELVERDAQLTRQGAQAVDSEFHIISNAIAAATAEANAAAGEYQTALEVGDAKKATESQRKMSRAEARLVSLEDGKAALDSRVEQMRRAPAPDKRPAPTGDHVEDQITRYSPRTQNWLRQHKECVTDDKTKNKAMGAHYEAVADGHTPDSDSYFQFLDTKLGFGEKSPTIASTTKPKAAPAAPVSRDVATAGGNLDGQRVKLSSGEVKAAGELGLSLSEYARRKLIMTREGRYATMAMPSE